MRKFFFYVTVLLTLHAGAQRIKPYYGPFPEPAPHKHMLFYLQRTIDRNTVIYELNYDLDGEVNFKNPVRFYWIAFEEGGKIKPLTYAQIKFAFGLETKLLDRKKKIFQLNLSGYKKVNLYLRPGGKDHDFRVYTSINNKPVILSKIHVNITGGTHLSPIISSLELTGKLVDTDSVVTERIWPRRE